MFSSAEICLLEVPSRSRRPATEASSASVAVRSCCSSSWTRASRKLMTSWSAWCCLELSLALSMVRFSAVSVSFSFPTKNSLTLSVAWSRLSVSSLASFSWLQVISNLRMRSIICMILFISELDTFGEICEVSATKASLCPTDPAFAPPAPAAKEVGPSFAPFFAEPLDPCGVPLMPKRASTRAKNGRQTWAVLRTLRASR
mmetsp:Transcript_18094/g.52857  ORF Transcript_18094/g.52857 Transcript_18094/m.52857 type:complete len:201 (+) Transcript_18094:197-799(+)